MSHHQLARATTVAALGTALLLAPTAPAKPIGQSTANARQTCGQRPLADRLQAPKNAAGVIFRRKGDTWHVWDNQRDGWRVTVEYNYAGLADDWRRAASPSDGGQHAFHHNVRERYRYLCFRLYSPTFGYTKSVRSRT